MDVIYGISIVLIIVVCWVAPIWLGIHAARKNNRAALWMLFGIHPIGGWIAFILLACLPRLKPCPQCAEKVKESAKICRFCKYRFNH